MQYKMNSNKSVKVGSPKREVMKAGKYTNNKCMPVKMGKRITNPGNGTVK